MIVLIPLTLFETSYDSVRELLSGNDLWPKDVAAGETVRFGGSNWQFVSLKPVEVLKTASSLPSSSVPLTARFLVEIGNPDLQNLWLGCSIRLVDPVGRLWQPASIPGMPSVAEGIKSCGAAAFSGAQSGERMVIEESFLVPREVATEVRPTLGVGSERPSYLRFARPL